MTGTDLADGTALPRELQSLLDELRQLPVQHLVAARLLAMLEQGGASAADLGRVISADPALTAQVIRLANMPIYGLRDRIGSAERAVMVLGFSTVRAVAATSAMGLLGERGRAAPEGFWTHSIRTAAAGSVVARTVGASAGEAFSIGMLHDVGVALLFRHLPLRYDRVSARAAADTGDLLPAEQDELGITHPEVGIAVLEAWRFPEDFVEAVATHHEPPDRSRGELARVLLAGEALAHALDDLELTTEPAAPLDEALHAAGIDPGKRDVLVDEVRVEVECLAGFLTSE